jgi:hypothetical protein
VTLGDTVVVLAAVLVAQQIAAPALCPVLPSSPGLAQIAGGELGLNAVRRLS